MLEVPTLIVQQKNSKLLSTWLCAQEYGLNHFTPTLYIDSNDKNDIQNYEILVFYINYCFPAGFNKHRALCKRVQIMDIEEDFNNGCIEFLMAIMCYFLITNVFLEIFAIAFQFILSSV